MLTFQGSIGNNKALFAQLTFWAKGSVSFHFVLLGFFLLFKKSS